MSHAHHAACDHALRPVAKRQAGRGRASHGFTLIEVLVVVGILALLISLLVPALANARERVRLVACGSNLRQIAMGWHEYLKANHDHLPRGPIEHTTFGGKQGQARGFGGLSANPSSTSPDPEAVPRKLNPYLGLPAVVGPYPPGTVFKAGQTPPVPVTGKVNVFQCPGDTGGFISSSSEAETVYASRFNHYGTSYHTNRIVVGPTPPQHTQFDTCYKEFNELANRIERYVVPSVSSESRLLLMGDYGFDDWQNPGLNDPVALEFHSRTPTNDPTFKKASRQSVVFMDGHATFVPIRKGIFVTGEYSVVPFRDLERPFAEHQQPGPYIFSQP